MASVAGGSSRRQLIAAAERLYAERGVDGVSMRELGLAAGQRNTAAVQYHFGGREDLIAAIFDNRMPAINARRTDVLDRLDADPSATLRDYLRALVYPLVEGSAGEDNFYAPFLARLLTDPARRAGLGWDSAASIRRTTAYLRRELRPLGHEVVKERLVMLNHVMLRTIADHRGYPVTSRPPAWASRLVDAVHGLLTAPVSPIERRLPAELSRRPHRAAEPI